MCRSSPHPHPRPKPGAIAKAKAKALRKNTNPPRPLEVPGLGRHPPHIPIPDPTCTGPSSAVRYLHAVLTHVPYSSVPGLGPPAYLIAAAAADGYSPRPASPLPNPLLATVHCTHCTAQLHQSVLSSSSNSSFPPLHIPTQSNPTCRPLLLSPTNTCPHFLPSLNRKSNPFSPLVQPWSPNIRSIANRPTVLPFVKPHRQRLVIRQPSPAQPGRPSDLPTERQYHPPPPVTRPPSNQSPPPQ